MEAHSKEKLTKTLDKVIILQSIQNNNDDKVFLPDQARKKINISI